MTVIYKPQRTKQVKNIKLNRGLVCAGAVLIAIIYVNNLPFMPNYHASELHYVYH